MPPDTCEKRDIQTRLTPGRDLILDLSRVLHIPYGTERGKYYKQAGPTDIFCKEMPTISPPRYGSVNVPSFNGGEISCFRRLKALRYYKWGPKTAI